MKQLIYLLRGIQEVFLTFWDHWKGTVKSFILILLSFIKKKFSPVYNEDTFALENFSDIPFIISLIYEYYYLPAKSSKLIFH